MMTSSQRVSTRPVLVHRSIDSIVNDYFYINSSVSIIVAMRIFILEFIVIMWIFMFVLIIVILNVDIGSNVACIVGGRGRGDSGRVGECQTNADTDRRGQCATPPCA